MNSSLVKGMLAAGILSLSAAQMSAQGFSVKGNISGMPDSVRVTIYEFESADVLPNVGEKIAAEYADKGTFSVKGEVKRPMLAMMAFQKYNSKTDRMASYVRIPFMLENCDYTVSTDLSFDSLSNVYPDILLYNIIKGGKAQQQFAEYRAATIDAEKAYDRAAYLSASKYFESNDNPDTMAVYDADKKAKKEILDARRMAFIKAHPDYFISSIVGGNEMLQLYKYTDQELNDIAKIIEAVPDTALQKLNARKLAYGLRYTKSMKCPDFNATTVDGDTIAFSGLRQTGKPVFIDFWASWCGPCRAAIPHVKDLNKKYGDRLQIVSVSVDENKAGWEKAMAKEQMPWTQLWLGSPEQLEVAAKAFSLSAIPRLILLNGNGEIICSTNKPDEVTAALEKLFGE